LEKGTACNGEAIACESLRDSTMTNYTVTLTLTDEEEALLAALARERGLSAPADVLRALLREVYDAEWDRRFAESQAVLGQLAAEAHEEYVSGRTEDFDPDTDPDAP
jgi:hypothetical protein